MLTGDKNLLSVSQWKGPNNPIVLKEVMFCWPWTFSPLPAKHRLSKAGLVFTCVMGRGVVRKGRKTWIISSSKRAPGRSLPGSFLQISLNRCYTQWMLLWPANVTVWQSPIKEAQIRGKTERKIVTSKESAPLFPSWQRHEFGLILPTLTWDCSRTAEPGVHRKDKVIHPFRSRSC